MAIIIDATLNGSDSNSYTTLAEANTYFESRLYSDNWENATDDIKNRALVMATRRLDNEKYYGSRSTTTQALAWSRSGLSLLDGLDLNGIIPRQIKEATYELAIYLLSNDMSQKGTDSAVKSIKVGTLEKEYHFDRNDNTTQSNDELPPFVKSLIEDISISVSGFGQISVSR